MIQTATLHREANEFTRREMGCLIFAVVVHSLLFLWKGGVLQMLDTNAGAGLGETLVEVGFRDDSPYDPAAGAPGEAGRKKGGLLGNIKKMITGGQGFKPRVKQTEVAMGSIQTKIDGADEPGWAKTDTKHLTDKGFVKKAEFAGANAKKEMALTRGESRDVVQPNVSQGSTAFDAKPNLQEKSFKVASKDMPFKIVRGDKINELQNVNMVPVDVGNKTDRNVRSLDSAGSGGAVGGAALKSRSMPEGGSTKSGTLGGGFSKGGGGGSGSRAGSGELAMGGGGMGGKISDGSGTGYSGTGTGGGGSVPGGTGQGQGGGSGTGGGYGGGGRGAGFGTGTGLGSTGMMPRRTVAADKVSGADKAAVDSDLLITGALAKRLPITNKILVPYEFDCRVALRARVDWAGRVLDGIIVEISSGSPSFDKKVIAALKQWIFSKLPAERANEIQEGVITFLFRGV